MKWGTMAKIKKTAKRIIVILEQLITKLISLNTFGFSSGGEPAKRMKKRTI